MQGESGFVGACQRRDLRFEEVVIYRSSLSADGASTSPEDGGRPVIACPGDVFRAVASSLPSGKASDALAGVAVGRDVLIDHDGAAELVPALDGLLDHLGYRGSLKAGLDVSDADFSLHAAMVGWMVHVREELERAGGDTTSCLVVRAM